VQIFQNNANVAAAGKARKMPRAGAEAAAFGEDLGGTMSAAKGSEMPSALIAPGFSDMAFPIILVCRPRRAAIAVGGQVSIAALAGFTMRRHGHIADG
jgi:hypothetical protein